MMMAVAASKDLPHETFDPRAHHASHRVEHLLFTVGSVAGDGASGGRRPDAVPGLVLGHWQAEAAGGRGPGGAQYLHHQSPGALALTTWDRVRAGLWPWLLVVRGAGVRLRPHTGDLESGFIGDPGYPALRFGHCAEWHLFRPRAERELPTSLPGSGATQGDWDGTGRERGLDAGVVQSVHARRGLLGPVPLHSRSGVSGGGGCTPGGDR